MAGRLAWIFAGGAAIVAGMAFQDGDMFSFEDERRPEARADQRDARIVVAGKKGEVDPQTVRALTGAVGELVKAETALAIAEGSEDKARIAAAEQRRERAESEVERLKQEVQRQAGERSDGSEEAARAIARQEVQSEIRETVREAVRGR